MIRRTFQLLLVAVASTACVTSQVASSGEPIVTAPSAPSPAVPKTKAPSADAKRLHADVNTLAVVRDPGSPGWRMARGFCEDRLRDLGFDVSEQRFVANDFEHINVIGEKRGTSRASEKIVLSAHYDHVWDCPGADDDASGVAAILEASRLLKERTFPRTLVVACWDLEEEGLVGSTVYAKAAREHGDDIRLAVALDAVGFTDQRPHSQRLPPGLSTLAPALARKVEERDYRADFIAVVHDPDSAGFIPAFERESDSIGLTMGDLEVSRLEQLVMNDVMRADHASFWLQGYPGVLLSDSGEFRNPAYHCYNAVDTPETLDYGFLAKVTSSTAAMIGDALEGKEQLEAD